MVAAQEVAGPYLQELRLAMLYWPPCSKSSAKFAAPVRLVAVLYEKVMIIASRATVPPTAVVVAISIFDRDPFGKTMLGKDLIS